MVPGDGLGGAAAAGARGVRPQSRHRCGRARGAHPRRPRTRRQPEAGLGAAASAAAGAAQISAPRRRQHVRELMQLRAHCLIAGAKTVKELWDNAAHWHDVQTAERLCLHATGSGLSRQPLQKCGCCH